jgi:hypothetical protein
MKEADLYKEQLREAKEHLSRWEELGRKLNKLNDPPWKSIQAVRQAGVKELELLIDKAGW